MIIVIGFTILLVAFFISNIMSGIKEGKTEIAEEIEKLNVKRRHELKELIEKRESRITQDEFEEEKFWEMIENSKKRSKDNYKNNLGILKDHFNLLNPEELILLDNLLIRLYRDNINYDLLAASTIIFKSSEVSYAHLLMSLFITRGQVFFYQACSNPKLLIGKTIEYFNGVLVNDIVEEVYYNKTKKLIPLFEDSDKFKIPGEQWKEKDLPSKYPEIWMAFA